MDSDGVLTNPSEDVVVKPCTPAEVAFYESANVSHRDFAYFMPDFMGTLQLGAPSSVNLSDQPTPSVTTASNIPSVTNLKAFNLPTTHAPSTSIPPDSLTAETEITDLRAINQPPTHPPSTLTPPSGALHDPVPLKGKKLETDLHIVLQNIAGGFKHPNILDLKLGARLWADDAKPDKRARLDKVSGETTSGSLGFRIAGMRVWQGTQSCSGKPENGVDKMHAALDPSTNVLSYNKLYGRMFNADNVIDAFREYLLVPSAGVDRGMAHSITSNFLREVIEIRDILQSEESRMYSASILLVYEGDPVAWKEATKAVEIAREAMLEKVGNEGSDTDDDVEDEVELKPFAIKLIDFAHATWTPGMGPDTNMLQGVKSTIKILEQLEVELST